MKVIRVKARVAPKACMEEYLNEVYRNMANDCCNEIERLRNELTAVYQENEHLQAKLAAEKKEASERYDFSVKASANIAARLVNAMDEVDAARAEAEDLRLELMERNVRIDELERRIEWLQAHSDTDTDFVS